MKNEEPLIDPGTTYRIVIRGRVDLEWLQYSIGATELIFSETKQMEDRTVIEVHTDQSGIVGLVRKLHGLGITILQLQIN